jgi:hypothetical protein
MARDSLSSSGHSKSSHHGKGAFLSITVRKDDPSEKAGIRLEQEANGRVRVSNIAKNGLFHDSELEIGDIVLSINAIRLSSGQGPEVLVEVANRAKTVITVVVKKPTKEGSMESQTTAVAKKRMLKTKKETDGNVMDNNKTTPDMYYSGMAKHNADGSLNTKYTQEDIKMRKDKHENGKMVLTTVITANKMSPQQAVGIQFAIQNQKLFVVDLDETSSIFASTALEIGDRVLSVNDMNFRVHADDEYAAKICKKAKEVVTLVVEKNDPTFVPPGRVVTKKKKSVSSKKTATTISAADGRSTTTSSSSKASGKPTKKTSKIIQNDDDTMTVLSTPSCSSNYSGDNDDNIDKNGNCIDRNAFFPNPKKSNFKIEKYTERIITAPKAFAKQQVGLDFRIDDRLGLVYIYKILDKSLFLNTTLEEGDWILSINNVNLRGNGPTGKPSPERRHKAALACMKAKESISMVVLKDESVFLQKKFNLDDSTSDLNWLVDSTRGLNMN